MSPAETAPPRRMVYALLITVAAALVGARILAVERVYEPRLHRPDDDSGDPRPKWPVKRPRPTPTLGGNDRSRWATVRALVDEGTYVIGHRDVDPATGQYHDAGITEEDGWGTFDKVLNPETHDFYSSKPPLLPTLLAGEYWTLKKLFGWSITDQVWQVVRTILLTVNGLPLVLYLVLLARLVDRWGTTDWGRLYVLAAACFGTFLTTFAVALNNHSVATCSAVFALYPALSIWSQPAKARATDYLLSGFFAGFTACNELPAASFAAALAALLLWRTPRRTLLLFAPAALVPVAAFFLTNYLALGMWRVAYSEFGGPWYEYAGSHWKVEPGRVPHGIDYAGLKETKAVYALNLLVGHHGIFSLSPIFLLAVAGMVWALRRPGGTVESEPWPGLRMVALLALLLSVVVVTFTIFKTNNYGGWTSGPRWLIWLTPFWLLSMLPAADWLSGRRWGRIVAYAFLGVSVFSAAYPAWNPWRHPWLYNWLEAYGWVQY